jgi:hypothetical protein
MSLYCAAWLFTQPDSNIVVYSTSRRASTALLNNVKLMYNFICEEMGKSSDEIISNQEVFSVRGTGRSSTIHCYPSNQKVRKKYI